MGDEVKYTLKDLNIGYSQKELDECKDLKDSSNKVPENVKKQSKNKYVVVTGYTTDELKGFVEELLNQGYQLQGGVATSVNKMMTWYHQALTK